MIRTDTAVDDSVRSGLLKLAHDLSYLANAKAKPVSVVLAEARAKLRAIEQAAGEDQQPFTRITAAELATGKFDLTYLIDGVLVKDQPAGLVAPKKSLKTNIGVDLAISLATGGRFLGYFRVAEPKQMAMFSGESGMATIQESALRINRAAGVTLAETGIIFSDPRSATCPTSRPSVGSSRRTGSM
jgi:RecA-family ATPase